MGFCWASRRGRLKSKMHPLAHGVRRPPVAHGSGPRPRLRRQASRRTGSGHVFSAQPLQASASQPLVGLEVFGASGSHHIGR